MREKIAYISKILFWIILIITTNSQAQSIPQDKKLHFIAGTAISGSSIIIDNKTEHPFWNSVLLSVVIGTGKEIADTKYGTSDVKDIYATVIGGVVGGGLTYIIKNKIKKRHKRFGKSRLKYYN